MEPNRREIFMNIPATRGLTEQSFEESRVLDYFKAYSTTGKPPQLSPQLPLHPAERARLGLPPLFQPYVEVGGRPSNEDPVAATLQLDVLNPTSPQHPDLNSLANVQIFTPTTAPDPAELGQTIYVQSIVAQPTFSAFSFEELRCHAYRTGKIFAAEATSSIPGGLPTLVVTPPSSNSPPTSDQHLSITCTPAFEKHSFEELQLAFRRTGHELASDQIIQLRVI